MSVYISGLEMPQDGRITLQIDSTGGVYVVNKFKIISEKYEESMTATGIQPHGRLVDLDQIIDEYWDGYYMRIGARDLEAISSKTVIEAEE